MSGSLTNGLVDRMISVNQESTTILKVRSRSAVDNLEKDSHFCFMVSGTEPISVGGG